MKIKAKTNIRHDGKSYGPDDEMEVSDKIAAQLVESGAAVLVEEKKYKKEKD